MKIKILWLLIFPLLVWFVFTYPLILDFSGSLYGDYLGDSAGTIARFNEIGKDLSLLRLIDFLAPFSLIFRLSASLIPATAVYNLAILFAFLGTFFLGLYFLKSLDFGGLVSFFLAFILTIAPIRLWYSFEWPNHAQWGFILLYLTFLFRFLRDFSYKGAILGGFFFSLALAENFYHGFMLFFLTVFALAFTVVYGKKKSPNSPSLAGALLIFGLTALIFSLPTLYRFKFWVSPDAAQGGSAIAVSASRSPEDSFTYSARPWHYFISDINHPIFGDVALKIHRWVWSQPPYYLTERFFPKEHTLYLSFTLLLLSGYALFKVLVKKEGTAPEHFYVLLFVFLAAAMMIFSFPPYVGIGGFKLYFPSYFIYKVIPQVRAYARFGVLVFICNAALACFGLRFLIRRFKDGGARVGKNLVLAGAFLLMLFEFANFPPFRNTSTHPPEAYQWLGQQGGDFAYLEYPTRIYYTDKLYQHVHGKEILNPYHQTSEEVENLLESFDAPEFVFRFKALGGRYIFFHRPEEKTEKQKVAESWGYPAWGTHDEAARRKAEKEPKKEEYFLEDRRFRKVKEFDATVVFEVL